MYNNLDFLNSTNIYDSNTLHQVNDNEYQLSSYNYSESLKAPGETKIINREIYKNFSKNVFGTIKTPEKRKLNEQQLKKLFAIQIPEEAQKMYKPEAAPDVPINWEEPETGWGLLSYESRFLPDETKFIEYNEMLNQMNGGEFSNIEEKESFKDISDNNMDFNNFQESLNQYDFIDETPISEFMDDPMASQINTTTEAFTHNNMVPFFRGQVKQNADDFLVKTKLENFTGQFEFDKPKQKMEVETFFEPNKNVGWVNGMPNMTQNFTQYYEPSLYRQSEKIIPEIRVRPGRLGDPNDLGLENEDDLGDGFHPLLRIMPKDTDEIRIKPKITYDKPTLLGEKGKMRGILGDYKKSRPDTFYENKVGEDGVGSVRKNQITKQQMFSDYKSILKLTNASTYGENKNYGGLQYQVEQRRRVQDEPEFKSATKSTFDTNGDGRNMLNNDSVSTGAGLQLNQNAIRTYDTQRYLLGNKTIAGITANTNESKYFKSSEFIAKATVKQSTSENTVAGITGTTVAKNRVKYEDEARATIKQSTSESTVVSTPGVPVSRNPALDYETEVRPTVRTAIAEATFSGPTTNNTYKTQVWDYETEVRPTARIETSEASSTSNLKGQSNIQVKYEDEARPTQKSMLVENTKTNVPSYSSGYRYAKSEDEARNTQRQNDVNMVRTGQSAVQIKDPVYDAQYNMEIRDFKQNSLVSRAPVAESVKLFYDKNKINMKQNNAVRTYDNSNFRTIGKQNNDNFAKININKDKKGVRNYQSELINPLLVKAFKNNPYTKSLASY